MTRPPPHLREPRDPPATRTDMVLLALLFIALPLGIACLVWCKL